MAESLTDLPIRRVSWAQQEGANTLVMTFLDAQLRPDAGYSVKQEFPSLYQASPGGESIFYDYNGNVASHVAFVARTFHHPAFDLKVGLIGSVVTDPKFRGRGLASTLLSRALEDLKKRGCAVAVLWSDKPDFYAPLGFHRAGRERDIRFALPVEPMGDEPVPFDPARHSAGLLKCYQMHDARLDRSEQELAALCAIPRTRVFVTEKAGEVTSYLAVQKGADFENYIHEWGGEISELRRNVAWVQSRHFPKAELTLISPPFYDLEPLRDLAPWQWDGVLGLMKVLDLEKLTTIYLSYLKSQKVEASWDPSHKVFKIAGAIIPVERDEQALRLIFGSEKLPAQPVLPFFLWGFDSV